MHWLAVPRRVRYKLAVKVHLHRQQQATRHPADYCVCVRVKFMVASIYDLPGVVKNVYSTCSPQHVWKPYFSVAGPTVWNSLPDNLHDNFWRYLKNPFLYWTFQSVNTLRVFYVIAFCK